MKTFKHYLEEAKPFNKMSDKELKKWLEINWTDEAGISKVFGTQLKTASKEASKRKIKWKKK
tara:strand:- start:290 stop:475 length:186 start_codon:yes stop_codon:yes gene_type:complete